MDHRLGQVGHLALRLVHIKLQIRQAMRFSLLLVAVEVLPHCRYVMDVHLPLYGIELVYSHGWEPEEGGGLLTTAGASEYVELYDTALWDKMLMVRPPGRSRTATLSVVSIHRRRLISWICPSAMCRLLSLPNSFYWTKRRDFLSSHRTVPAVGQ